MYFGKLVVPEILLKINLCRFLGVAHFAQNVCLYIRPICLCPLSSDEFSEKGREFSEKGRGRQVYASVVIFRNHSLLNPSHTFSDDSSDPTPSWIDARKTNLF